MKLNYQTLILKKNEMPEEFRTGKYKYKEDLVYGMQLTYDESIDVLDLKYNPTKRIIFPQIQVFMKWLI